MPRKIKIGSGPRAGESFDVSDSGGTMRHRVDTDDGPSVETPMETADRLSGGDVASNAGKQSQSTDHQNSY